MRVELTPIGETDLRAVQDVLDRSSDYYQRVVGHPAGPAEATSIYAVLPDGVASYDDKLLLGVVDQVAELIGIADVVRDWPHRGSWVIGLLLLVPEARGRGIGREALQLIEARAASEGAESMRAAVYRGNPALGFWRRQGYVDATNDASTDPIPLTKGLS